MGIGDIVVGGGEGKGEGKKENQKIERNIENKGKNGVGIVYTDRVNSRAWSHHYADSTGSKFFDNLTWLTSDEATEYLRLPSVGALRALVCKRKLPFHKLGRCLRFKKIELDRLLEGSRKGGF
jgi:excisionase family DNA binding protein